MTAERSTVIGDATLTASGIARLAGVGRAAVSNWRRRYADFPAPVGGTPTSPYFNAREIDEWLRKQGKLSQAGAEQWVWRHIETYQPAARLGEVLAIAGAYLLAWSEQVTPLGTILTPNQLTQQLGAIDDDLAAIVGDILPEQWGSQLMTVIASVDQLAREQEPVGAFEYLHNQYVSSAQSMSGLAATPDVVAQVMLTLAGSGARTFDFACGTGSILRVAAERALADGTVTHCLAQEIKSEYALIALIRLWFVHRRDGHPGAPTPTVRVGDSLLADAYPDLHADVVLANFPFGIHDWGHDQLVYDARWAFGLPPRTEPELAWLQHALSHLASGGTAVVLMPPAAAARTAGRRIRAELVRRGWLRAVVALPAGLMSPPGIGLQVWVLTEPRPEQVPDARILFIDAAGTDRLVELIGTAWRQFVDGDHGELPGVHRAVPAIDLLDDRVDLTPQRHLLVREQVGDAAHIIEQMNRLNALTAALQRGLPEVRPTDGLTTMPRASLADLVRSGSMSVELARGSALGAAIHRTGDITSAPQLAIGDIIVTASRSETVAHVVTADRIGAPLAPGMHLVRVDSTRFDPWFVAGTLSRTGSGPVTVRASGTGSGTPRIDLRRYTIPVVPLPEQQAYGKLFRQLAEFEANLDAAVTLGGALVRDVRAGINSGALESTG